MRFRRLLEFTAASAALVALVTGWSATPAGAAASPAPPVSGTVVQASSLSAGATDVTYSVSFVSPRPLGGGVSRISVSIPGAVMPTGTDYFVGDDRTGFWTGAGVPTVSGSTATVTVPYFGVSGGDLVTLRVDGVGNRSTAGPAKLQIWTTADPARASAGYTLRPVTAVKHVSLQVNAPYAGAETDYAITFVSPDRLVTSTPIYLSAPKGTSFAGVQCYYWDETSGFGTNCGPPATSSTTGCTGNATSTSTIAVPQPQSSPERPDDVVTLQLTGVRNADRTGPQLLTLCTAADPAPVTMHVVFQPPKPVQHAFATIAPATPRAAGATWQLGFVTTANLEAQSSSLTIVGPSGTSFAGASISCWDVTANAVPNRCSSFQASGNKIVAAVTANAFDLVDVKITGVTNPPSLGPVKVFTSADTGAVDVRPGRSSYQGLLIQGRDTKAADSAYSATVVTPSALTANKSIIQVSFPAGTGLHPSCALENAGIWGIFDDTTGTPVGIPFVLGCVAGPSPNVERIRLASNVAAGDELTISAFLVKNPGSSGTLSVAVSPLGGSPPGFEGVGSFPVTLHGATAVSRPVAEPTSTSAGATAVSWVVCFQATSGLNNYSVLQVALPTGSLISSASSYVLGDVQAAGALETGGMTWHGSVLTIDFAKAGGVGWMAAGHELRLVVEAVANPKSAGTGAVSVSTTTDPTPSTSLPIAFSKRTGVAGPIRTSLTSRAGGAGDVTYSLSFRLSNALVALGSSMDIGFPTGTGLASTTYTIYDDTTGTTYVPQSVGFSGSTVVLGFGSGGVVGAGGDLLTVVVVGVTNAGAGSYSLDVATSSDPVTEHGNFVLT